MVLRATQHFISAFLLLKSIYYTVVYLNLSKINMGISESAHPSLNPLAFSYIKNNYYTYNTLGKTNCNNNPLRPKKWE